jgi:transposase
MKHKNTLRVDTITAHLNHKISIKNGADILGMSESGFKKICAKYRHNGLDSLTHGLTGKPSNNPSNPDKQKIIELANGKYKNFNICHKCELLAEREDMVVNPETLRLWLIAVGRPIRTRKPKHREWREPKSYSGEMLQIDGSFHDWLGTGKKLCMINITDDATRECMLHFESQETIESACFAAWRWIKAYGVPKLFYADGRNMYHLIPDKEPNFFTQMCKNLGIETKRAYSAQAKGRVERGNGTHQNRLVPLLDLDCVQTQEDLNSYILNYEQNHNRKFGIPAVKGDCHRDLPEWVKTIDDVCWVEVERVLNNDWTIRYRGKILQIERQSFYGPAKKKVLVRETLSGEIKISYRGQAVKWRQVATF